MGVILLCNNHNMICWWSIPLMFPSRLPSFMFFWDSLYNTNSIQLKGNTNERTLVLVHPSYKFMEIYISSTVRQNSCTGPPFLAIIGQYFTITCTCLVLSLNRPVTQNQYLMESEYIYQKTGTN